MSGHDCKHLYEVIDALISSLICKNLRKAGDAAGDLACFRKEVVEGAVLLETDFLRLVID